MLKTGFARLDVTPQLNVSLKGYYSVRLCDGILDPLEVNAVAFDDEKTRAVIISIDNLGIKQKNCDVLREKVAKAINCSKEGVYIACTHTHLAPGLGDLINDYAVLSAEDELYENWLSQRVVDVAILAVNDLAPTTITYTQATVPDVSFVRRFKMKDGSLRTNPGCQNPNIDHPLGTPDELATLLMLNREGKDEIAITHFQTHPDVIGGTKASADWPGFVRRTYEKLVPNSKCIYINGAQGDTNHIDVRLESHARGGYKRSQYMGEKIAMALIANKHLAKPLNADKVVVAQKSVFAPVNKGKPEEIDQAIKIATIYYETNDRKKATEGLGLSGMNITTEVAKSCRIVGFLDKPDTEELCLYAIAVGDIVFAGLPGEPVTDIGRGIKNGSQFTVTLPTCCTNGYAGYFITDFTPGTYEAGTSRFKEGIADILINNSVELINSLK